MIHKMGEGLRRLEMTRFATLWTASCEFKREKRNTIVLFEPLNTDAPANARPSCSSYCITFYDHTGHHELERVNHHRCAEGAAPSLWLLDGEWWEVGGGEVRYRDSQWMIVRRAWRNTRAACMANAGWHYYRAGVRPGRWPWLLWDRLCCSVHRICRSVRKILHHPVNPV